GGGGARGAGAGGRRRELVSGRAVSGHRAGRGGEARGTAAQRGLEPDGVLVLPARGERPQRGRRDVGDHAREAPVLSPTGLSGPPPRRSRPSRLVQAGPGRPAGGAPPPEPEAGGASGARSRPAGFGVTRLSRPAAPRRVSAPPPYPRKLIRVRDRRT